MHLRLKSSSEIDRPNREYEQFHTILNFNKCITMGIHVYMYLLLKVWIHLHKLTFTLDGNPF